MDKFRHIDLLIGESLECMVEAASELKIVESTDHDKKRMRIGRAICELWEVRDSIYKVRPDLKRDFVREREENKQRYDELDVIHQKALDSEHNGDKESAINHYEELLEKSEAGYFTLLAEAGLFQLLKDRKT